jgi:serine/threonine protein kinase
MMMETGNVEQDPRSAPTLASAAPTAGMTPEMVVQVEAESSAVAMEPRRFGEYVLLKEIGRGGMGIVYRARQPSLDRIVALKMVLTGRLATPDDLQRFLSEAAAAGGLQHPNIVKVYEVGNVDGQHYFSMEFIEGQSLAQKLQEHGPLPSRTAARYARSIARAIHHAHAQRILHRDLKPSNILLDAQDVPHITDFGLAKRLDGSSRQTQTGAILGTPSYMSPEQAAGRIHDLGPTSDVYGVGAVLYEMLTGRPPFRSESPLDTIMQVVEREPVPPRLLNPKVDHDLETICLKCLEKDSARRYASAQDLADDLERYLNGETITARSFNVLDRLQRTLERSVHDVAFHTWSSMVLVIAAIVFLGHLAVFALTQLNFAHPVILATRLVQFVFIGLVFWKNRKQQLLPTSAAERELWTIWIGYMVAYAISNLAVGTLIKQDILVAGENAPDRWEELILYPFSSIASGLAFFIMGSNYWGRLYAIGLLFFLLAALMPLHLEWAPLEFGGLWSGALVALGWHLRHLGEQAEAKKK